MSSIAAQAIALLVLTSGCMPMRIFDPRLDDDEDWNLIRTTDGDGRITYQLSKRSPDGNQGSIGDRKTRGRNFRNCYFSPIQCAIINAKRSAELREMMEKR